MERGVHFGGNANNGANAGFAYSNSTNTPSNTNANIGSRLYFHNIIQTSMWRPHLSVKNISKQARG